MDAKAFITVATTALRAGWLVESSWNMGWVALLARPHGYGYNKRIVSVCYCFLGEEKRREGKHTER